MQRFTSSLLLAAAVSLAAAQSSTNEVVTIFLLGADQQPLVASVVDSDATATTLSLGCAPGTDGSNCGFAAGASVTVGPSTFHGTYTGLQGRLTVIPDCKLSGSPSATSGQCEQTFLGLQGFITAPGAESIPTTGDATVVTSSTASVTFGPSDIGAYMVAVTITAGKAEGTGGSATGSGSGSDGGSASGSTTGAAASVSGSGGAGMVQVKDVGVTGVAAGLLGCC